MIFSENSETNNYRTAYFILITFAILGMMICLFLFRYTGFFADPDIFSFRCSLLSAKDLLSRFAGEAGYLTVVWLCGFTVFALPCGIIYSLWRGFMCGYCAMTLAGAFNAHELSLFACIMLVICSTAIPALEICAAAKARCFSASLHYAVPDIRSIMRSRSALRYTASFLFISLIVFLLTMIPSLAA